MDEFEKIGTEVPLVNCTRKPGEPVGTADYGDPRYQDDTPRCFKSVHTAPGKGNITEGEMIIYNETCL